jgi:hypothetical protein
MKEAKMKVIDFKNKLAGTLFAIALLFGIGLATNLTAHAQYPYPDDRNYRRDRDRDQRDYRDQRWRDRDYDWRDRRGNRFNDGYPDLGGSFDLRQTALNAGANTGIKAGRDDRRRGRPFNYQDEREFQKATKDYSSRLGDLGLYRTYYRQAFAHGYADGYAGY